MTPHSALARRINISAGTIDGAPLMRRTLSQMKDAFADRVSCEAILRRGDPLLYTVSTCAFAEGPGELHCGLGVIHQGRVGDEYFMTRGHVHAKREEPEVYVGLRGRGIMLMQREDGSGSSSADLSDECLVYVPGHTAHRTINTGTNRWYISAFTPRRRATITRRSGQRISPTRSYGAAAAPSSSPAPNTFPS